MIIRCNNNEVEGRKACFPYLSLRFSDSTLVPVAGLSFSSRASVQGGWYSLDTIGDVKDFPRAENYSKPRANAPEMESPLFCRYVP
jgi:hypothetical protein